MKIHIKLRKKENKLFNNQEVGFLKGHPKMVRNWAAKVAVNPNSQWGCDRDFLPRENDRAFAYNISKLSKGDYVQIRKETLGKDGDRQDIELDIFAYILELYDDYLELIVFSSLEELLEDASKKNDTN